jgi:hypothetical protein
MAVDAPRAHLGFVFMAFAVNALMAHAGGGLIAFQVDAPTDHAEAVISMASAINVSMTFAASGADSHSMTQASPR